MANERVPLDINQKVTQPVETRLGQEPSQSIEVGGEARRDGSKPQAKAGLGAGMTADFGPDGVRIHETDKPVIAQGADDGQEKKPEGTEATKDQDQGETTKEGDVGGEALPEFKADAPEVVAAYDKAFVKDGALDVPSLSNEWWKTAKRSEDGNWEGSLPDGVYEYLATKGFSKDTVKGIEAGQVALQVQKENQVYQMAGGPNQLKAALDWARSDKGYTPAQKERYQAAIASNDMEAIQEQVDILIARASKAGAVTTTGGKNPLERQTAAKPQRTVTNAGGGGEGAEGAAKPYANYAEYSNARREALAKGDQTALNETRQRLRASPWYGSGGSQK